MQDTGDPFWFYWGEAYTDFYFTDVKSDWVYVRDYVDPEPSTALGAEETTGLVGHWTFDEGSDQTAADSSGNGNDGTLGSSAGADANDPSWACVAGGNALSFDGAVVPNNDYVDAGSASTLDDLGPMTVSAWIKPSTVAGEFYSTFVAKSDAADNSKWIFEIDNTLPEVHALEYPFAIISKRSGHRRGPQVYEFHGRLIHRQPGAGGGRLGRGDGGYR